MTDKVTDNEEKIKTKSRVFTPRAAFKPFEYPDAMKFVDAINQAYWLVSEFSFEADKQDFYVNLNEVSREAVKRALLAISQIEVSVKKFWAKHSDKFPKAEFDSVGATFAESEVRHARAYSHLLDVLNLNSDFDLVLQNPVIKGRVDYLTKYLRNASSSSDENYTFVLTLFSMFIENVSLFSQFAIIRSFNRHYDGMMKSIDNVIQATMKEEECFLPGTEVLTPRGWRKIEDMQIGDDVIQYHEDGTMTATKVRHKVDKEYSGNVYEFSNSRNKCIVTENHDMVIYRPSGSMEKIKAKDVSLHSKVKIPVSGRYDNEGSDEITFLERLYIAIQADGTKLYWTNSEGCVKERGEKGGCNYKLSFKKDRKKKRIEWILSSIGMKYNTHHNQDGYTEYSFNLDDTKIDPKKFDWVDFSDKSFNWVSSFVDEVMEWDGSYGVDGSRIYSSTDSDVADVFQTAVVLAGYRSNKRHITDDRSDEFSDYYKVSLYESDDFVISSHGYKKTKKEYDGHVYCISVDSGIIVTRYEGKTFIAGNCHALYGAYLINIIKEENPHWFNDEFEKKLHRACKKAYEAECNIIDWIFETGELEYMSKDTIKEYIKKRINYSMELIGVSDVFEIDQDVLRPIKWFDDEAAATVAFDFFNKKSVNYTKRDKAFSADDLF